MGTKRLKLVLGEKQVDTVIGGLALLYAENEMRRTDFEDSSESWQKEEYKKLTDEMKRAEQLRLKLAMMKQGA